ncbi:MAG: hypothetical protein O2887_03555 [Bacteroidetes bacterium]|nr:hypothetical protein [Bacteroidota bacterium]MDA1119562.1 hypothetical protein [Bacteroidota bacterium]
MKRGWIYLLGIIIFVYGCGGSEIKFSAPQPNGAKSLTAFPSDFQSNFNFVSDSTIIGYFDKEYSIAPDSGITIDAKNTIEITDKAVFNHLEGALTLDFKILEDSATRAQFPRESIMDTLINQYYQRPNYQFTLASNEDSVLVFNVNLVDTMFYASNRNVIKKYKKGVYLNVENEAGWSLYQMLMNDDLLSFTSISNDDETILRRILKNNEEDYENEVVSPSKNSFNEFLYMGGFENRIGLRKGQN